jgi:hypothetical protein
METGAGSHVSRRWKVLYQAAVLELDRNRILQRIAEAESAINERIAVAVRASTGLEEVEGLTNALTVLHDLRKMAIGDRQTPE